jgi:thiol-disulfide isomerase/thioredoxin
MAAFGGRAVSLAAEIGMKAPPLEIAQWIKGQPVVLAEGGGKQICVVEFWATWCPPCRASIPHLTAMQKKLADKGAVFIGITDEPAATVRSFVGQMGDTMDYTVAIDRDRKTFAGYMEAFGIHGIPHAFVVDRNGVIAWQGHPMEGLEEALEKIVAGTYDLEEARISVRLHQQVHDYLKRVSGNDRSPLTKAMGEQLVKDGARHPDLLNELAWAILTDEDVKHRDLELALRAARTANDASGAGDAAIIDTYARALFDTGKTAEAIDWQRKAVALCRDPDLLAELKKNLARYEARAK